MSLTGIFISRPIATTLLMVGLLFFGITAYFSLPVSEMPNIDFPTIQVSATLPGADPETMASAVATPLERQFSSIAGISSMSSVNALGRTTITLQFDLDRDIDGAALDVQTGIAAAQGYLPAGMPSPPTFQKVNPADAPILYIRIWSESLPLYRLTEYAKVFLSQRISMVSGVSQVAVYGDQTYAARVRVNPDKLAAVGLGIDEVADALVAANQNLPTGIFDGPDKLYTIKADGQIMSAAVFNRQIIAWRDGKPVRVEDVGQAVDESINTRNASYVGTDQCITLAVRRQPGTNTIEVVDAIHAILPGIRDALPDAVEMVIVFDRSETIRESVSEVQFTLLLAVGLVVIVVYLFLKNLPATVVAMLSLPTSLIGTLAIMQYLGYSLDNLSLLALTLAVGFVVDDAIVMIENIVRHLEMGKSSMVAARDGAKQIAFTIVSMTFSLVVVFVPILFMAGIIGRLLHELAATITVAVLLSGAVTLSFTPMLCSRFLHPGEHVGRSGWLFRLLERGYEKTLHVALRFRLLTMLAAVLVLLATGWLFKLVPTGFIPATDSGLILGYALGEQGASFASMKERILRVSEIASADPNIGNVVSIIGVGGPNSSMNNASFFSMTKPASERTLSAEGVLNELRKKLSPITDLRLFMFNPPAIQIGGKQSRAMYQFTLLSPDTSTLYDVAAKFETALNALPEIRDVSSDMLIDGPQLQLSIDRDKASALGVTTKAIEIALQSAYAQRELNNIYGSTDTYKVVLEVAPEFQTDPDLLSRLYVRADMEKNKDKIKDVLFPLQSLLLRTHEGHGPLTINHTGQLTSVTFAFNVAKGFSLGDATKAIYDLARNDLPASVNYTFEGQATAFEESLRSIPFLLFIAVFVIYIILGMLYESFIHPLTILSGLPSAAFGGLLALLVFGRELNLYGFVGVIMLIGIVKKNAIMVIDFAIEAERKGKSPVDAVFEGCIVRFRPIIMTTVAAIAGILPVALAYGGSGVSRQPLGLVVAGGLAISQIVTLYLTPVFYTYMDQFQSWLRGRKRKHDSAA